MDISWTRRTSDASGSSGFAASHSSAPRQWSAADAWSLRTAAEMIGIYIERSGKLLSARRVETRNVAIGRAAAPTGRGCR